MKGPLPAEKEHAKRDPSSRFVSVFDIFHTSEWQEKAQIIMVKLCSRMKGKKRGDFSIFFPPASLRLRSKPPTPSPLLRPPYLESSALAFTYLPLLALWKAASPQMINVVIGSSLVSRTIHV